jgi:hypothetical protein
LKLFDLKSQLTGSKKRQGIPNICIKIMKVSPEPSFIFLSTNYAVMKRRYTLQALNNSEKLHASL